MSTPQWTPEQLAAITLRGKILVSAAAGSGKTAVLVERLIRRITDPDDAVDVDRFLVVTFTKAAATEMRERVGKALDNALFLEHETREIERLLHQRTLLLRANITTLHSFCLELIRKYFYQLELDPAFRIADQAEADLLRQDALEELFENLYKQEDPAFLKLVDAFGSDRADQPLMDQILRLYEFAYSQPQPDVWLNELDKAYLWNTAPELMQSEWGRTVRQGLLDLVSESISLLERAEQLAQRPGGPAVYTETLQGDLTQVRLLNRALKEQDWTQVEAQFQAAISFAKLPAARSKKKQNAAAETEDSRQKELQEETKKLRDEAKKKLTSLKESIFTYPLEEQIPALREMGSIARTLSRLVREFAQCYAQAKSQRNVLDFTDLEHFALRLLNEENEGSLIAQSLREYFAEILVDEYQDINPVQENILQLVSRHGEFSNLFMVGDVKQSIYRFRMADPNLFLAKYNSLPHWSSDLTNKPAYQDNSTHRQTVIDLNRNFRSRREIVEGVNFLFRQIMTQGAGEITYDDQAALQYGASYVSEQDQVHTAEGPIEVHLIDSKAIRDSLNSNQKNLELNLTENPPEFEAELPSGTDETLSSEDFDKVRIEARLVSKRILIMVQSSEFQIYDQSLKNFRPVSYSDIVILMRSYSAVAPIYVEEFQSAGIPVYAETSTGYFGASEVETMLSLLKTIDNPRLDIPLAAVLRSPLVGLNGTELGKLRLMLPEGDFYEALALAVWAGRVESRTDEAPNLEDNNEFQQILNIYEDSWPQRLKKAQEILDSAPDLKAKVTEFWFKLQIWRTKSRRLSLADLLWGLYEETGYLAYVGTLPSGAQRQANLRVLYDRARRFEATRYRGLFRFLRFLERFQGQGKDMGNARVLGENENVVRLITVHASKGLEFPVVFVVGLGRSFNTQNLKGKMLLHSQLGLGMPIIDVSNNVRYPSLVQYAVKQRLTQEALAEELRILYVALTRAKERLLLYGNLDPFTDTLQKWLRSSPGNEVSLPDVQLRSAKNFLDWIGPALARHPQRLFGETEIEHSVISIPEVNSRWKIHLHQSLADTEFEEIGKSLETITDNSSDNSASEENSLSPDELSPEADSDQKSASEWMGEVSRRLNWQYPHLKSVRQVAKTSVSELKRQFIWYATEEASSLPGPKTQIDFKRPKFLQSTVLALTAAERGTALHTVMQHIPFDEWVIPWSSLTRQEQINQLDEFLKLLEQREILNAEQRASLRPLPVLNLLNSPLGQRLFNSRQLLREVPFTLTMPFERQRQILVQGVIDVVILSQDESCTIKAEIIDYKTDSFSAQDQPNAQQILQKRYSLQLSVYALAIQRLLHIKVSQCTLYSFTLGKEIALPAEIDNNVQLDELTLS